MSQVESTLRLVNGRLLGNRNWRISCDEDWDNSRHITLRRQLAEQEACEIAASVTLNGIPALSVALPENEGPVDDHYFDYEEYHGYHRSRETPSLDDSLETFLQSVESGELFDGDDDYVLSDLVAIPGTVTFDTSRPAPANPEDRRWEGLQDDLDAMQDFYRGKIQEHEIHLDGISSTHYYHANQTGIIAVDRFDLYGDRNPSAWWPILECA